LFPASHRYCWTLQSLLRRPRWPYGFFSTLCTLSLRHHPALVSAPMPKWPRTMHRLSKRRDACLSWTSVPSLPYVVPMVHLLPKARLPRSLSASPVSRHSKPSRRTTRRMIARRRRKRHRRPLRSASTIRRWPKRESSWRIGADKSKSLPSRSRR